MNRKEYMEELENLLNNIQENEREEALQYYNDYFDEAGEENEEQVIEQLGTPAKVAAIIKTSLQESVNEAGEFTERGYSDPRFTINYEVIDGNESNHNDHDTTQRTYTRERKQAKEMSGGKIALLVILCLFAIPVGLPLLGGLFGIVMAFLGVIFALFVSFAAIAVSFCIAGIVVFIVGIVTMFTEPITGIFSCGVALVLFGVGVLFVLLTVQVCYKFIPWIFSNLVKLFQRPLRRRTVV